MAIGSAPEYGTEFKQWGEMNAAERQAWWRHMRENWHPNLMNGFGQLVEIDR